jgi:hypothetical protein
MRWTIEEGLEKGLAQAKGEGGLDQDEVRNWDACYRFATLGLLVHAYLAIVSARARQAQEMARKTTFKRGGLFLPTPRATFVEPPTPATTRCRATSMTRVCPPSAPGTPDALARPVDLLG